MSSAAYLRENHHELPRFAVLYKIRDQVGHQLFRPAAAAAVQARRRRGPLLLLCHACDVQRVAVRLQVAEKLIAGTQRVCRWVPAAPWRQLARIRLPKVAREDGQCLVDERVVDVAGKDKGSAWSVLRFGVGLRRLAEGLGVRCWAAMAAEATQYAAVARVSMSPLRAACTGWQELPIGALCL